MTGPELSLAILAIVFVFAALISFSDFDSFAKSVSFLPLAMLASAFTLSMASGVGILVWKAYMFLKWGSWPAVMNYTLLNWLDVRMAWQPFEWVGIDRIIRELFMLDAVLTLMLLVPVAIVVFGLVAAAGLAILLK